MMHCQIKVFGFSSANRCKVIETDSRWFTDSPPGRDSAVTRAASLFLDNTTTLWPLCANSWETARPMPREPPNTTASLDITALKEKNSTEWTLSQQSDWMRKG